MVAAWDEMSDATKDLLFDALDYAIKNARIDEFGFTPFAMILQGGGKRVLSRFVADGDMAECVRAGRQALKAVPAGTIAVALAWDGYLHRQGERTEAVFVETYELGMAKGVLAGQRYMRVEGQIRQLGNPVLQGEAEPLVRVIQKTGDSSE